MDLQGRSLLGRENSECITAKVRTCLRAPVQCGWSAV